MAEGGNSSSSVAIVAIVVLVLAVGMFLFLNLGRGGGATPKSVNVDLNVFATTFPAFHRHVFSGSMQLPRGSGSRTRAPDDRAAEPVVRC